MGVASNLTPPTKIVYKIDITGASDVSGIVLPASGPLPAGFTTVSKSVTPFVSIDATTLAAFGNRVPEKWEGLAIGPKLPDGSWQILAGTDNDYSVTQNGTGTQTITFDSTSGNAKLNIATAGTGAITFNHNTVLADNLDITNGSHADTLVVYARTGEGSRGITTFLIEKDMEGFSVAEIAEVTNWSISKVKVRAHRARANLRRVLQRYL